MTIYYDCFPGVPKTSVSGTDPAVAHIANSGVYAWTFMDGQFTVAASPLG